MDDQENFERMNKLLEKLSKAEPHPRTLSDEEVNRQRRAASVKRLDVYRRLKPLPPGD
jgi:hypothetical protein